MEDKTLVTKSDDAEAQAFRFREDYLLFGLLVRHGLCAPGVHDALVNAQGRGNPPKALADLLADTSSFTDKQRADVAELLKILATPDLRKLLPNELPELQTIVNRFQESEQTRQDRQFVPRIYDTDAQATEVDSNAGSSSRGISSTAPLDQHSKSRPYIDESTRTSLSVEEITRVEKARHKSALIGKVVAGHVVLDRIGSGGQGEVYLAKQISLQRYVAMKKLEVPRGMPLAAFIDAFRREAMTLGQINHARIVKVYEIFVQDDEAFFTMEYLKGKTLKELVVNAQGPLPIEVVANIACQACSALQRTSEDNLVHRDIKPANIMLDENGDVKIVDFGLAEASTAAGASAFAGTPHFAAPEQIRLEGLSPATDMYSLGGTLFYCLTAEVPFPSKLMQDVLDRHLNEEVRPPSSINTALSRDVDRIIARMMAKDPAKRYATFDACYEDWRAVLTGQAQSTRAAAPSQLLGDSLLRLSRQQRSALVTRASLLGGAWVLLVSGTLWGEYQLRFHKMSWVLEFCGTWGTYLLAFSLSCIFYVAAARRGLVPTIGSLRAWLYTHIATAVVSVAMILIHSGNFLRGILPGDLPAKPLLTILISTVLLVTAISGSVGLVIFRALRQQLQIEQLALRGGAHDPKASMRILLGAQLLSGWRLVHYPLAVLFILLTIVHIVQSIKFSL